MFKIISILLLSILLGCEGKGGTTTGNPYVSLKFDSYNQTLSQKVGAQSVDEISMCFKRLRFKMDGENTDSDPSTDSDNIDLELGLKTISSSGTDLGTVQVPPGIYTRIEFDLEKDCLPGYSIKVQNSNGIFQTEDRITIKFEGTFTVKENELPELLMSVQAITSALNTVTNDSEIKSKAESVSGSF